MIGHLVSLTEIEIEALIDLAYYGGEYLYSTWDSESLEMMDDVDTAIEKLKMVREDLK